jgi:paraquat-inducible protein A
MGASIRNIAAGTMILAATACLVLGLTVPVVRLSYLYFWTQDYSLSAIVRQLYTDNELFLAAVIFVFSIVFPAFKLVYLLAAFAGEQTAASIRLHQRLSWLGKWSMLDVLVLALVVFYAKSTTIMDAVALPGVYYFSASVILSMLAYAAVDAAHTGPTGVRVVPRLSANRIRPLDSVPSIPDTAHRPIAAGAPE